MPDMDVKDFPFKICLPYQNLAMGGMYTFLFHFTNYLKKHNIAFTHGILNRYDFLFVNSWSSITPYYKILTGKLLHPHICIVHRIDGAAQDYGRAAKWDQRQKRINAIADLTIFQSRYGKFATREKFRVIAKDGPVIYNPVDTVLFSPHQAGPTTSSKPKIAYVSFSTNPKKGADLISQVAKENQDIDFILIGRFNNHPDLKNVRFTAHLNRQGVAEILGTCHFFLFLSKNEACPNVVLEAMASGLPVLYLDSGGTAELVGNTGLAVTVESFREAFEKIRPCWHDWSQRTRTRAENLFAVDGIIPQYLNAMLETKK